MDIIREWERLMGANAGEIMDFTSSLVKQYWRLTEQPSNTELLDAYRRSAISRDYNWLISASAEFIFQQMDLQVPVGYLLREWNLD